MTMTQQLIVCSCLAACTPAIEPDARSSALPVSGAAEVPTTAPAPATAPPIRYTLDFADRIHHFVDVTAVYPVAGATVTLMMPVWTPGSYKVRDYSRNVEGLTARSATGAPLPVQKTRKNRWRVNAGVGATSITVQYRVYCHEMSVQTSFVDADLAIINGAAIFLTLLDDYARPHDVRLRLPTAWARSVTALPPHPDGGRDHFRAADFDALVDAPILIGNPALYHFDVGGVLHRLADFGEGNVFDGARAARDLQRVVEADVAFWGEIPYDNFTFLNVIGERGGGLEHKASNLMMANRWATTGRGSYLDWLGLASHEFFHTWNVKRLRPAPLGPFDYEQEVYTRSLWIAEGLTSYYDDLLLRRAGLLTRKEYLARLSKNIDRLQTTPGRAVLSLAMSSYDAWIKLYGPDENRDDSAVSYYTKGAVVGFLLDAAIRDATQERMSLDDVMRLAYVRHAKGTGFTPEEFRQVASEVAGNDLHAWFAAAVAGTEELDYTAALSRYGLRFTPADADGAPEDDEPQAAADPPAAFLGVGTGERQSRLIVTRVIRGSGAYAAGVQVGDEILGINGYRVEPGALRERLTHYRPDSRGELLVARRGRFVRLEVEFGSRPDEKAWLLEPIPEPTAAQRASLDAWLGPVLSRAPGTE